MSRITAKPDPHDDEGESTNTTHKGIEEAIFQHAITLELLMCLCARLGLIVLLKRMGKANRGKKRMFIFFCFCFVFLFFARLIKTVFGKEKEYLRERRNFRRLWKDIASCGVFFTPSCRSYI